MNVKKGHLTVLSCGIGKENLTELMIQIVSGAGILAGGQRLLDLFPDFNGEKTIIGKCAGEKIAELADLVLAQGKEVCVLASGDALFHGIGKTFSKLIPAEQMTIIPNISAMQSIAAKLCLPWDNAQIFSIHGKHGLIPWRKISAVKCSIIYCDPKCTAADLAKFLIDKIPAVAERPAAIGSDLGLPTESVKKGRLKNMAASNCSGLSILVLLPCDECNCAAICDHGLTLGLMDSDFAHEKNLITHSEVRAVAISKLRLGAGVMWDIGAGSGSVGIEAAGLCQDLTVYAVEKNIERIKDIEANIREFGLDNIIVKTGAAQELMEALPAPRAIFIGGGGEDIAVILKTAYQKLLPGGYIVATAVLLETRSALAATLKDECIEVLSLAISRSKALGNSRMMKSENSIEIFVYRKQLKSL